MHFDGKTYDHTRDRERLSKQYERVFKIMSDGEARTLADINKITGYPPASISARLRDMRKVRFGEHTVDRTYIGNGLFSYRLVA